MIEGHTHRCIRLSVGTVKRLAIKPKIVHFKSVRVQVNQCQSAVPEWHKVMQRMIH